MFILILILILILPGTFLPMALKSRFSSEELVEMGVYLEESQTLPSPSEGQVNCSQGGLLRRCATA
jgi:hypothetical protein